MPDETNQQVFNKTYWLSKSPAVRALPNIEPQFPSRFTAAAQLAQANNQIDVPIMVWGADPFLEMGLRKSFGYTWVPSARMPNVPEAPGVYEPGVTPYDPTTAPASAIKVSLDLADYPPFETSRIWISGPSSRNIQPGTV